MNTATIDSAIAYRIQILKDESLPAFIRSRAKEILKELYRDKYASMRWALEDLAVHEAVAAS